MLKHSPKAPYNGLTIVLSNPSRFDTKALLTSGGGYFFERDCLQPNSINRYASEIRLKEDRSTLLPNTKAILFLGEEAMHTWLPETRLNHIGELRGTPLVYEGVSSIVSYLPQECVDIQGWEQKLNPLLNVDNSEDGEDGDDTSAIGDKRRHGKTSKKNWSFWLRRDCFRVSEILENNGVIPQEPIPEYIIYPPLDTVVNLLLTTKNETLYFDCETDDNLNFTCFSFSFGLPLVYVIPVVRHDYTWAYSRLPELFRALAVSIRNNCLVAHNGASFDFFVLGHKYRIPIGKVYDSLLAHHRCWPEVEKSLGHGMSHLTWQAFHKDEGNFAYGNQQQAMELWKYCGKDVYGMILLKTALDKHARKNIGLTESIKQANDSVKPYLTTMLQGIRYDEEKRAAIVKENDRLCMQYIRFTEFLVGKDWLKKIKGTGKSCMLNSNTQCVKYFHGLLDYPMVGQPSKKTGKPSLGKKNIFKLKLKVQNPVLDLAIVFRETLKETGSLGFTPWRK